MQRLNRTTARRAEALKEDTFGQEYTKYGVGLEQESPQVPYQGASESGK